MAEIEMWHLFINNFWLICKQTKQKYVLVWHYDIIDMHFEHQGGLKKKS